MLAHNARIKRNSQKWERVTETNDGGAIAPCDVQRLRRHLPGLFSPPPLSAATKADQREPRRALTARVLRKLAVAQS